MVGRVARRQFAVVLVVVMAVGLEPLTAWAASPRSTVPSREATARKGSFLKESSLSSSAKHDFAVPEPLST
jgi:hypothetical protein